MGGRLYGDEDGLKMGGAARGCGLGGAESAVVVEEGAGVVVEGWWGEEVCEEGEEEVVERWEVVGEWAKRQLAFSMAVT